MKKAALLLALLATTITCNAQDLIALTGGDTIQVTIHSHDLKKLCVSQGTQRWCCCINDVNAFRYQGKWITVYHSGQWVAPYRKRRCAHFK